MIIIEEQIQHDQRADDREEKAGGVKQGPIRRTREDAGDKASDDGTDDTDDGGGEETHVLITRHDGTGNETNNETDDDRPEDVEHRFFWIKV